MSDASEALTPDEARILSAIARCSPIAEALLAQVNSARVAARRWTGVGLYVDFTVPEVAVALPHAEPICYGVTGMMAGRFCWFTLWLTDDRSRLQFLEVATAGPDDLPAGSSVESLEGEPV